MTDTFTSLKKGSVGESQLHEQQLLSPGSQAPSCICAASQPGHVHTARPLACRALDPDLEARVDLERGPFVMGEAPMTSAVRL